MNQLLDDNLTTNNKRNLLKILSLLFLLLPIAIAALVLMKVFREHHQVTNPLLPFYSRFYINGELLNFMTIQFVGVLPAFILRLFRYHVLAILSILLFLTVGVYFSSSVELYKWYYHLI